MSEKARKQIQIFVNGTKITLDDGDYTGAQLRALGNVPDGETLYLVHGNGDGNDVPVAPDDVVKIHPNMRFESAPDGGVS